MRSDIASVVERDPAARSAVEVALLYPGVHAVEALINGKAVGEAKFTLRPG